MLEELAPPCHRQEVAAGEDVVGDPDDVEPDRCLRVGPPELRTGDVADAEMSNDGEYVVRLTMTDAGATRLDMLAERYFGRELAVFALGRLVSVPTIQATAFEGRLAVGGLSKEEAVQLTATLGGDATLPPEDSAADDAWEMEDRSEG